MQPVDAIIKVCLGRSKRHTSIFSFFCEVRSGSPSGFVRDAGNEFEAYRFNILKSSIVPASDCLWAARIFLPTNRFHSGACAGDSFIPRGPFTASPGYHAQPDRQTSVGRSVVTDVIRTVAKMRCFDEVLSQQPRCMISRRMEVRDREVQARLEDDIDVSKTERSVGWVWILKILCLGSLVLAATMRFQSTGWASAGLLPQRTRALRDFQIVIAGGRLSPKV